jgi:hypothetical protein
MRSGSVTAIYYIKTDTKTGLAKVVRVQVPAGHPVLKVEVPALGASAESAVDTSNLKFVTVALRDGKLTINPVSEHDYRREPRGYA